MKMSQTYLIILALLVISGSAYADVAVSQNPTPAPTPSPAPVKSPSSATAAPTPTPAEALHVPSLEELKGLPFAFGFQENGIELLDQEFQYSSDSENLQLTGLKLESNSQFLEIGRDKDSPDYILKFSWPKDFIQSGMASISAEGAKDDLFSISFLSKDVSEYASLSEKNTKEVFSLHQGYFETKVTAGALDQWASGAPIKFCLKNQDNDILTVLCSKPYRIRRDDLGFSLGPVHKKIGQTFQSKVLVDGRKAPKTGSVTLKGSTKVNFAIQFANGSLFATELLRTEPTFDELYQSGTEDKLVLRGHGAAPRDTSLKTTPFGWQVTLSLKDPYVDLPTKNGFYLKQPLKFHVPPLNEDTRPFLLPHSQHSTYKDHVDLHGILTGSLTANSADNEAHLTAVNRFDWNFKSTDKLAINKRQINFDREGNAASRYVANYSVYRALPYEASGQFIGLFSDASNLLVEGDVFAQAWFEKIFNSESYLFSVQRWGVSAEYALPLLNANNQYGHSVGYSNLDVDLKYRLVPGVWNYDTSYGVLLSFQTVAVTATSGSMVGVGGFYGEKLPHGVDDFINKYLHFLRYPKWVDFELDYYPLAANSAVTMGFDLNFLAHLKVYMKPNFFVQGGLGFKSFSFTNNNDNIIVQNYVYSGSLGAGWNF